MSGIRAAVAEGRLRAYSERVMEGAEPF